MDWGIGHATRCVPLIKKLIENDANVIIAADKRPLAFLKREFPNLKFIKLSGYNISYSRKGNMVLKTLLSIPKILFGICKEHKLLKYIINIYNIDVVISDNRYGLWNKNIKSIFITHQIMIKCPKSIKFIEFFLFHLSKFFITKYDECWVPDYKGSINLSGDLSHKYKAPSNTYFIGPLSRFYSDNDKSLEHEIKYDLLVILSGPEPQRTILEEKILFQLKNKCSKLNTVIARGITEEDKQYNISENIKVFSHLESEKMKYYIQRSNLIVCRPGYSSIMDIIALGKNAVFIPTQGQTEQEYLSEYYLNKNIFFTTSQNNLNLMDAVKQSDYYSGISFNINYNEDIFDKRIKTLLKGT